jgi:hypothetical protein
MKIVAFVCYPQIDVHAGMLYDSIMLYAFALNQAIQGGHNATHGQHIAQHIFNTSFQGNITKYSVHYILPCQTNQELVHYNGDTLTLVYS